MDDADEAEVLIDRARDVMEEIMALGRTLLALGASLERVHRNYIAAALDLLGEAEAQALLATDGDRLAREAIGQIVAQLTRLRQEAHDELNR